MTDCDDKNVITLKEYIDTKLEAYTQAVKIASQNLEKRLDGMNEFREQLRAQASSFITREYYDAKHETLQKQVDELKQNRDILVGKASQNSVNVAYIISGISLAITIINFVIDFILKVK
jgi:hypothetical protein